MELDSGVATRPRELPRLHRWAGVSASGAHSSLALRNGRVLTWGNNNNGQIGDGTTTLRTEPFELPGLSGMIAVANPGISGGTDSYAVRSDGAIVVWVDAASALHAVPLVCR
jgi:alpha-tubulin suppressor-like RCC1 family protein